MTSASNSTWLAAEKPQSIYKQIALDSVCATCGMTIDQGVDLKQIETPTTANHADYFCYGTQHVCPACAWLFAAGKGRPGNYIAYGGTLEYTVISLESVVDDKRPWLHVLRDIAALPGDTPIAGVMTTDVKPRLWPRVKLATVASFGLYLHVNDYDVSEFRRFNLVECLDTINIMLPILATGFSKSSLYHGLFKDHARASKHLQHVASWESQLLTMRGLPHFLPALIAAGVTKGDKHDVKSIAKPA